MQGVAKQPHIHLTKEQMRPVVLTVGDPGRVKLIAGLCDKAVELASNREYTSYDCTHGGQQFIAISHGVGSAGCAICFEELIELGAKVIIRAGTAGSLRPTEVKQGDVCVCFGAAIEDGVSRLMAPQGYPAVATPEIHRAIVEVAKAEGASVIEGTTLSSDMFYKSPVTDSTLMQFAKGNVDVIEMEISTLFVIARLRGIKAGALVVVDGSPLSWDAGNYDPSGEIVKKGKENMLNIAIKTCAKLTAEYSAAK
eukprot:Trichotokara_eunicae@DN4599_c0_g1_i2.p1